jgi:hypothetical protein
VYVDGDGFAMKGGTLQGNTAIVNGAGVYVDSSFSMEGNALVDPNNAVYLTFGTLVTISEDLSHNPAANITPAAPVGNHILDGPFLTRNYWRFLVNSVAGRILPNGMYN